MNRLRSISVPTLVLLALAAVSLGAAAAGTVAAAGPATLSKTSAGWQLKLSAQMYQALIAYNPRLRVLTAKSFVPSLITQYKFSTRESPWAVLGDFTGDGKQDLVFLTHVDDTVLLLSAIAEGKGYRVAELSRIRDGLNDTIEVAPGKIEQGVWNFLRVQPKGVVFSALDQMEVDLKTEGVRFEYWKMSAEILFWDSGHLRRLRIKP